MSAYRNAPSRLKSLQQLRTFAPDNLQRRAAFSFEPEFA